MARFIEIGYRHIHLYTEPWRLPALNIYLNLGYVPFFDVPDAPSRWRAIRAQLQWPFAARGVMAARRDTPAVAVRA